MTSPDLRRELRAYLNTLAINGDNIGDIRRSLFVPWESQWNAWVRDDTATRETMNQFHVCANCDERYEIQTARNLETPTPEKYCNACERSDGLRNLLASAGFR